MNIYTAKKEPVSDRAIVIDDMILTKEIPTTAGSKMLDGYVSLFEAEVLSRLTNAGYELKGKTDVGEFAIDLVGETSYNRADDKDEVLLNPSAEILKEDDVIAAIDVDVNGSVRRAAAQNGLVSLKPTYGTVSRFGIIATASSGETVSVMAKDSNSCEDIISVIAGHDDKDGTSLSDGICSKLKKDAEYAPLHKIAVLKSMLSGIDDEVSAKLESAKKIFADNSIEVNEIDDSVIPLSRPAWNIVMSAELCNNVSRYDGVKYGYRAEDFDGIDELYTNSRTEAFGDLLKSAIIYGSDTLATNNFSKVFDKALKTRRIISEHFEKVFAEYDAVLMPACSKMKYTSADANKGYSFVENFYTAPASITGLPAVVAGGVQLVGKQFSDIALLEAAKLFEGEDR